MSLILRKGNRVGRYRIVERLGVGGMGEVYAAQDETLDRRVALKVLPPGLSPQHDRLRRFVSEARAASALSHPNLVSIFEIGEAKVHLAEAEAASPVHFIAMELIPGQTLEEVFRSTPRPELREIVGWLAQAASAIASVHAAGIVHRDLKPGNIMVTRDGHPKVLDFGQRVPDSRGHDSG